MSAGCFPLPAILEGRFVVIHAPKCVLVLSAGEIAHLVHLDPETWIRALRRGKAYRRAEAARRRIGDNGALQGTENKSGGSEFESTNHKSGAQ